MSAADIDKAFDGGKARRAGDVESQIDRAFLAVWQQALVEEKKIVTLGEWTFSVRRTPKSHLAQVDFALDGLEFRGLEQNPQTKSRWAKLARDGSKVMQFLRAGRYVGVVVDGVLKRYGSGRDKLWQEK